MAGQRSVQPVSIGAWEDASTLAALTDPCMAVGGLRALREGLGRDSTREGQNCDSTHALATVVSSPVAKKSWICGFAWHASEPRGLVPRAFGTVASVRVMRLAVWL